MFEVGAIVRDSVFDNDVRREVEKGCELEGEWTAL